MAVKDTEVGRTFSAAEYKEAAKAKKEQLLQNKKAEIVQSVGTGYTNNAITQEKVLIMAAKNPELGNYVGELLLGTNQTESTSSTTKASESGAGRFAGIKAQGEAAKKNVQTQPIDRYTKNVLQTAFSAEITTINKTAASTDKQVSEASEGQTKSKDEAQHDKGGLKEDLAKILQPISSFTGSTLGALPNLLNNPTGALSVLPTSLTSLVDRVNPMLVNQLDGAFKQLKVAEMGHLPSRLLGSIKSLATAADKLLSVPADLVSDLYGGLMKITQQISKLVDRLLSMIQNFFFGPSGVLDQVIPNGLVKQLIESIGGIGAMSSQLTQLAGGFNASNLLTSQLNNFASQGMSALSNPTQLLNSYAPPQVQQALGALKGAAGAGGISQALGGVLGGTGGIGGGQIQQAMGALKSIGGGNLGGISQALGNVQGLSGKFNLSAIRDPAKALSQIVPPQLMSQIGKMNQIPGLGSAGSMGFGLGQTLESLKSTVAEQALSMFKNQEGILGPLLNLNAGAAPIHDTTKTHEVAITGAASNPNVPVVQGVPIQGLPSPPIFQQNRAFQEAIDNNNPINRLVSPDPGKFQLQEANFGRGPTKAAAAAKQAPLVMVPNNRL